MAFPQTTAVDAIRGGQEFWRLETPLESSGDIYESEVSGTAFAIGPNSDISCVDLTYFDPSRPSRSNIMEVSVTKPLIGRLDALASQQYITGQRARIFASSAELIPQRGLYKPENFNFPVGSDVLTLAPTNIDLLQYFGRSPTVFPRRTDKILFDQAVFIPFLALEEVSAYYTVPFYGRKYAFVMFNAQLGIDHFIEVFGVSLDTGSSSNASQRLLRGPTLVREGVGNEPVFKAEITAENDGSWDFLLVRISTLGGWGFANQDLVLKVRTSDTVGG